VADVSEPPEERPERFKRDPPPAWWAPLISEAGDDDPAPAADEPDAEAREAQERPDGG
jgi:hypothetical protein